MKKLFVAFLIFFAANTTFAQPKELAPDVLALLGFYQTQGYNFIIRENNGELELLYYVRDGDYAFSKANIFQMQKERYDEYTIIATNPREYSNKLTAKFERDKNGKAITCIIDKIRYTRAFFPNENNNPFTIKLVKPLSELSAQALLAPEPKQNDKLLSAELVDIAKLNSTIKIALPYAAANNPFGQPLYEQNKAVLDKNAALALIDAHSKLKDFGYGIVVLDSYRPWYLTKAAFDALPEGQKHLLDNPQIGSKHNTALAVDVTLYDLATGQTLDMISGFDEPSLQAYSKFQGSTTQKRQLRDLLVLFMQNAGFTTVTHEWWHFDYKNIDNYRLLNKKIAQVN